MFQSIKEALNNTKSTETNYDDILKLEVGKTYTLRLLPFIKDPSKTFFHYFQHGWISYATGQYVSAISPNTWGERDPIAETRYRIWKTGTEDEKKKMGAVKRQEKWLVNVYVIDDPTNPENNGKVKILRYGKQIQNIIMQAIEGERSEEFGAKIFDLSAEGATFKIKSVQQGDWPTYANSYFTTATKLKLSKEEQEEILDQCFELDKLFPIKAYEELEEMLQEHYYVEEEVVTKNKPVTTKPKNEEVTDEVPDFEETAVTTEEEQTIDEDLENLLKDL